MTFTRLLPGSFCLSVAVETTDEHEHLGLEPMNIALHQTQENRKKKEREKEKGGMGHQMGHLPHFRM